MFGTGISKEGDVLDLATERDIIQKSGAWFAYNGEKIGQGRENAKKYLMDNPDIFEEISNKVIVKIQADPNSGFKYAGSASKDAETEEASDEE